MKLLKCGSRDLNPGRPASTGPKPVPFGLSGTPAYENKGYIETIKNLNKSFKMLRPGFEPESSARKAEMIGRTTPPEHIYKYSLINMGPMGFEPMTFRL